MSAAGDNGDGQSKPSLARGVGPRGVTSFLTTALLMIFLTVTIGLWGWAAWWGLTKLISLLF
jgi:hypothetical protein